MTIEGLREKITRHEFAESKKTGHRDRIVVSSPIGAMTNTGHHRVGG